MSSLSAFSFLQSSLGIDITGEWNSLVNLNVGGCAFSCQRRTFKCLADSSILCRMALTTDRSVARTEDGSIILDRDPDTFRHVLNFLRSGAQKLLLPDDFADWELLLEDARVYELPALADAVRNHPKYQQRCFLQGLPQGVMLRWVEGSTTTAAAAPAASSANQQQQHGLQRIELFPPLQLMTVEAVGAGGEDDDKNKSRPHQLRFQDRVIGTVDEAVTILLFTYQMHIETWHRDTIAGGGRIAHTVFLTRK